MMNFSNFWEIVCVVPMEPPPSVDNISTINDTFYEYFDSLPTRIRGQFILTYFRALPIIVVIINTIIMLVVIHKRNPALRVSQTQSHKQARSVTVTLLGFTTLFLIFEGFGYAYLLALASIKNISLSRKVRDARFIIDKYLLLINSMSNVIAYVAFN